MRLARALGFLVWVSMMGRALATQAAANLVGTWQAQEGPVAIVLTLAPGGTGTLDQAPIKYRVQGNTLAVDEGGTLNNYTFALKGNTLTLSGGDLTQPLTFQ